MLTRIVMNLEGPPSCRGEPSELSRPAYAFFSLCAYGRQNNPVRESPTWDSNPEPLHIHHLSSEDVEVKNANHCNSEATTRSDRNTWYPSLVLIARLYVASEGTSRVAVGSWSEGKSKQGKQEAASGHREGCWGQ